MILFAALTFALLAVALMVSTLAVHTLRIRAAFAIPAKPVLIPTSAEQVPPDMAEFLAAVVPALNELGFLPVASVQAPQMLATLRWTQILFVRRDRGDRASVVLLRSTTDTSLAAVQATPPTLMFATELPDGRAVRSSMLEPPTATSTASPPPSPQTPPALLHDRVRALYERHRADVNGTLGPDVRGVMPDPGHEIAWLQERAGAIAAALAERNGFTRAANAASYHMPWRLAVRGAWAAMWARDARPRTQGFEVVGSR